MLVYLLQGLTFGLSAGASPGPFHALLISQTLKNGWRRALPAVFAPLLSDGPIIALVLLVLTQMPDVVRRGLQIAGGFFLLWLAWLAYQDFRAAHQPQGADLDSAAQSLRKATLVNLLNPNPYIFWGVVGGPILLEAWEEAAGYGVIFIAGFYVTLIGTFTSLVALLATTQHLSTRLSRALSGISALALCAFGLYQLAQGIWG